MTTCCEVHHCLYLAGLILAGLASRAAAGVRPVDLTQFFVAPDQETVLQWTADADETRAALTYAITNYRGGRVVAAGEAAIGDARRVEVPVKLARGYYEIAFAQTDQRFGICAIPEHVGPSDPFFCMDAALSWLEMRPDIRDGLVRMLKRIGVAVSRERLSWGAVHWGGEQWDWQAGRQYESLRQTYDRHGVKILEMFHDAPGWMGTAQGNPFPTDLLAVARSWERIERQWHPYWAALEIWNEPDIFFGGNLPADQYVPVAKAVAFALRDAKPATPLVGGVLTNMCPDAYRRSCALNGLLDQINILSFHTYLHADTIEEMVQTYRTWLKANGKESMPLWITESGRPWPRGPERPPAGKDAYSALDVTIKAIEARACGVAAYFPFVYVYYEERDKNFAMMGKEVSPLRSMAAYAQAVAVLSGKSYRGDLVVTDPAIKRARVFGNDKRSVIVLYTGQAKGRATAKLDIPFRRLAGLDGRTLSAKERGVIPVQDGLTYVWADSARIAGALRTDTPAARLYAVSRQAPPQRPAPSPIVLQHLFDPAQATAATTGYTLSPEAAAKFALRIRVHNLAERPERVMLTVTQVGVQNADVAPNCSADVAATGHADITWELDLGRLVDPQRACTLIVSAKGQQTDRVSPLAIDVNIKREEAATQPAH
ncbi:MAG: hypothetical protein JXA69_08760 [Phycisphaerae bacterium]|nr:hypothetical protein [Phycisphaerae bacterium]